MKRSKTDTQADKQKKVRPKKYMSLKNYLTVIIILIILFCTTALYLSYIVFSYDRTVNDIKVHSELINDSVKGILKDYDRTDIIPVSDKEAVALNSMAVSTGGRILVINRDYKVIYDTSLQLTGKYVIGSRLISTLTTGVSSEKIGELHSELITAYDSGLIISYFPVGEIIGRQQNNLILFGIIYLLMILMGILFATAVAKRSTKDINHINQQVRDMAEGNFDANISVEGFREYRYLGENYNSLVKKLDSVDSSRQEFVSNVSHELKTPMTSMKVLAESLLQNENATAEEYREFMGDIVEEVDRGTRLINDLLMLVKTDKKNTTLDIKEKDIDELINIIIKRVQPIADARNISLQYNSYKNVVAEVDEVKMLLVISNILTNAIKYNVDNGWVRISLNADNKYFYLKVADSGVGIPDDEKDKVFDRFYRVDKARSRNTGGTGLGLSIARNVVISHNGSIKMYSESGKGTTFTIRMPLKQELVGPPPDATATGNKTRVKKEKVKRDIIGKDKKAKGKTDKDRTVRESADKDRLARESADKDKTIKETAGKEVSEGEKTGKLKKKKSGIDKTGLKSITSIMIILIMVISLGGCSFKDKKSTTTEYVKPSINSSLYEISKINVYRITDKMVSVSEVYQLKQPEIIPNSVEELMNLYEFPDGTNYKGYTVDERGNVEITLEIPEEQHETRLLVKAEIVLTLSQIAGVNEVVMNIVDGEANVIERESYTPESFYFYQ